MSTLKEDHAKLLVAAEATVAFLNDLDRACKRSGVADSWEPSPEEAALRTIVEAAIDDDHAPDRMDARAAGEYSTAVAACERLVLNRSIEWRKATRALAEYTGDDDRTRYNLGQAATTATTRLGFAVDAYDVTTTRAAREVPR